MRQIGILAAAGLIALEEGPKRLHEDHTNAKALAIGLAEIPGVQIDADKVVTNIVIFDISATGKTSDEIVNLLEKKGVLAVGFGTQIRMVTHMDVSQCDVANSIAVMRDLLSVNSE